MDSTTPNSNSEDTQVEEHQKMESRVRFLSRDSDVERECQKTRTLSASSLRELEAMHTQENSPHESTREDPNLQANAVGSSNLALQIEVQDNDPQLAEMKSREAIDESIKLPVPSRGSISFKPSPKAKMEWQDICRRVMETYRDRTNGSYILEQDLWFLWSYEDVDVEFGELQAKQMTQELMVCKRKKKKI